MHRAIPCTDTTTQPQLSAACGHPGVLCVAARRLCIPLGPRKGIPPFHLALCTRATSTPPKHPTNLKPSLIFSSCTHPHNNQTPKPKSHAVQQAHHQSIP